MTHPSITFTRADASHISGFLELQSQNLLSEVPKVAQAGGFVTTPFTVAQLEHMIAQEDIFIALYGQEVVGYIVCASWAFLSQYLIFAYMATLLGDITQFGEKITAGNSYQYGPICIAEAWRGKGVLEPFFAFARQAMQPKYPYALTFVNTRNQRSREAHERKLGLQRIQPFSFSGQNYAMFGFTTAEGESEKLSADRQTSADAVKKQYETA